MSTRESSTANRRSGSTLRTSLGVLQDRRVVDAGNVSGGLMLIELQKVAPDMWRAYNSSTLNATGGTTDTAAHLFVVRYDTNDCELWVDGTSVASDTSGTYDVPIGIAIGSDRGVTTTAWIGDIPYVAQYDGDLEADGGFSSWANSIANYYGLTEGW